MACDQQDRGSQAPQHDKHHHAMNVVDPGPLPSSILTGPLPSSALTGPLPSFIPTGSLPSSALTGPALSHPFTVANLSLSLITDTDGRENASPFFMSPPITDQPLHLLNGQPHPFFILSHRST